jgi:NADH-quinone oxidoreductase subunit L
MGGLRKQLPLTFWTFLIASASLAALPLVTAGYYSKDMILWYVWAAKSGGVWLWVASLAGAFITGIYTFRMVFITFFGEAHQQITRRPGLLIKIPLVLLAVFSVGVGFVELPHTLGDISLFSEFITSVLPAMEIALKGGNTELILQIVASIASLSGIYLAYYGCLKNPEWAHKLKNKKLIAPLYSLWDFGWGFDKVYDILFVRPVVYITQINRDDFIDGFYNGIARVNLFLYRQFSRTQTGQMRWYLAAITLGAVITLTLIVFV